MKMRRVLILTLAVMVMLAMTAVPAFAASKQVVQTGDKYYYYNEQVGKYLLSSEWEREYESGYLKTHKSTNYNRNYDNPEKVDDKNNVTITVKYNKGLIKKRIMKYDDGSKLETSYSYKGKNVTTVINKYKGENSNKTTYTYNNKGLTTKQTNYFYENGKWVKGSYSKYTYDNKGRETKYEYYSRDMNDKLIRQNWYKVTYSSGKRTEKRYNYEDQLVNKYVYTLDSKGRDKKVVHTYIYNYVDKDPEKETSTTSYTYYKNNQIKKATTVGKGYEETSTYRSDGQIESYYTKGTDYERTTKYSYNKKGLLTKQVNVGTNISYDENGEAVEQTMKDIWKYSYDGYYKNKYPKVVYSTHNGVKYSKEKRTYKYFVDKTPDEALNYGMGAGG